MKSIVGVTRGTDKFESFRELLSITNFDDTLMKALEESKKKVILKSLLNLT